MKRPIYVRLGTIKSTSPSVRLSYLEHRLANQQARLKGRVALRPEIDLGAYTCRAVLDWVDVSFEVARETQFPHVQRLLESVVGARPFVGANSPGPGGVDRVFNVRFQEPHLHMLQACAKALEAKFGLVSAPYVYGLEVSVDFKPKAPSDEARARMAGVLSRHLLPNRDMLANPRDRPRVAWGNSKSKAQHLLHEQAGRLDRHRVLNPECDRWIPADATYYVGRKTGRAMWRVMDKVVDSQNPAKALVTELAAEEKRTRIEVRLDRLELQKLGIINLPDLLSFNLGTMQGSHFQFVLPTFHPEDRFWTGLRQQRFLNLGLLGLVAMDEERAALVKNVRDNLARQMKRAAFPRVRRGKGVFGSFVAYKELNERVSMALRKLAVREGRKLEKVD